jgi:hypothetical protein
MIKRLTWFVGGAVAGVAGVGVALDVRRIALVEVQFGCADTNPVRRQRGTEFGEQCSGHARRRRRSFLRSRICLSTIT